MSEKGFTKDEGKNLWIASDDVLNLGAKRRIGDKLHGHDIHSSDGAKYMSYFKVSISRCFEVRIKILKGQQLCT